LKSHRGRGGERSADCLFEVVVGEGKGDDGGLGRKYERSVLWKSAKDIEEVNAVPEWSLWLRRFEMESKWNIVN